MGVSRTSKMLAFINYRMRITLVDGRQIVGRFMAFDRHMNLCVADAEEHRKLPPKKGVDEDDRHIRRVLGFVLIRGEEVVSLTVEGPPPAGAKKQLAAAWRNPRDEVCRRRKRWRRRVVCVGSAVPRRG